MRFTRPLINAIIKAELPRSWAVERTRVDETGVCMTSRRTLVIPKADSDVTLYIFFHELCHALRLMSPRRFACDARRNTSANEEYYAEKFAMEKMRQYGFPVSRVLRKSARRDVAINIAKDDRIGWPVAAEVRRWAKA